MMNFNVFYKKEGEKPLDNILTDGGFAAIFRTLACVGDSFSSGELEIINNGEVKALDVYEQSWGQYIARMTGAKVYNFSRGGMKAKEYFEEFAPAKDFWNKEYACQGYIIALGENDTKLTERIIGEISDIDIKDYNNNKDTFMGNYAKIIQKYKEIQPDAKFFLVTMPRYYLDKPERREQKLRGNKAIRELSSFFDNTYLIDLFEYAPLYDETFKEIAFLNGHMSSQGYLITAKLIASYIDYIIRSNPKEFAAVGLIGKELK